MRWIAPAGYRSYCAMMERCRNPKHVAYASYGGRGIKVCDRWRYGQDGKSGFRCFIEDMGERPVETTLDRIDNDGGYSPENCRWATRIEQRLNQRVRYDSETGYKGVQRYFDRFRVKIKIDGRQKCLGYFDTVEEAAAVFVKARAAHCDSLGIKIHGINM